MSVLDSMKSRWCILLLLLCTTCPKTFAEWVVNPYQYSGNMTMTIVVQATDSSSIVCDSLQVVALSGDTCRGVESPTIVTYQGDSLQIFFLTIYGNEGDSLRLVVWDRTTQRILYQHPTTILFTNNGMIGMPTNPYLLFNGYQIFFDANGGVGEMTPQFFTHQVPQQLPPNTFQYDGRIFKGWSLLSTGCNQYDDQALFSTDRTDTLYAVWQAVTEFTATNCNSYSWNGITYTQSGDYVQHFQPTHGCDSMVTLHLTIYPQPDVQISAPSSVNYGDTVTLTASGAASYVWSTGATTASITISPTETNTYTVTGTSDMGCTDSASITITVSYIPHHNDYSIKAYPNPTHDKFFVYKNDASESILSITISDATGRKLMDIRWTTVSQTQVIDLAGLKAGLYYLELFGENGKMKTFKIVKE